MKLSENVNEGKGGGDSDDESVCAELDNLHMTELVYKYESDTYSSSDDGSESRTDSPVMLDDANSMFIFLLTFTCQQNQIFIQYFPLSLSPSIRSIPIGSNRFTGTWFQREDKE